MFPRKHVCHWSIWSRNFSGIRPPFFGLPKNELRVRTCVQNECAYACPHFIMHQAKWKRLSLLPNDHIHFNRVKKKRPEKRKSWKNSKRAEEEIVIDYCFDLLMKRMTNECRIGLRIAKINTLPILTNMSVQQAWVNQLSRANWFGLVQVLLFF